METTKNIDRLLETLPEVWDADNLDSLLIEHAATIREYVQACGGYGSYDITPLLQNFAAEKPIPWRDLQNSSRYLTIQFSKEGVTYRKSNLPNVDQEINPREVVKAIAKALKILDLGLGIDPGCVAGFRPTLSLMSPEYMTLDWGIDEQGRYKLFPAFRFPKGSPITGEIQDNFVSVIRKGRKKILGLFDSGEGGVVKAAR